MSSSVTPIQPARRQPLAFVELGTSGLKRWGGTVYEEFLLSLRGQEGVRVYREMYDNDPIIGGSLGAYENVIKGTRWNIKPGGTTNLALRAAQFLKECMDDMSHSWLDFMSEVVSFQTYGWAWHEVVYKIRGGDTRDPQRRSKYNDGLVGWRKMPLRLQSSLLEWDIDERDGSIVNMVQQAPPDYKIRRVPLSKSILFRTKRIGNNPEGRSCLRNVYRPWFFKKGIEEIEAIGIERDLIGLAVITGPEGFDIDAADKTKEKAAIEKTLASLRRDERDGLYLPHGWTIELLSGGGDSRRQFDINLVINRYDKRIALGLMTQAILLGMERVGSFALSETQTDDFFLTSAQGYLSNIAETFNMFEVPRVMRANPVFAPLLETGETPVFVPGRVTAPKLGEIGQYIRDLSQSNALFLDEKLVEDLIRLGRFGEPTEREIGILVNSESQEERRAMITRFIEDRRRMQSQQTQQGPQGRPENNGNSNSDDVGAGGDE